MSEHNNNHTALRADRREARRLAKRNRMATDGASVKLIERIVVERARRLTKQLQTADKQDQRAGKTAAAKPRPLPSAKRRPR